jgi:type VI secretion system protein ImpA
MIMLTVQNNRRKQPMKTMQKRLKLEQFEQALFNTSKSFQYQNYQAFQRILTEWQQLKTDFRSSYGD